MKREFVPVKDGEAFTLLAEEAFKANSALMEMMARDLPDVSYALIHQVVSKGGRLGIEWFIDATRTPIFALVVKEREGLRHLIAEVAPLVPQPAS